MPLDITMSNEEKVLVKAMPLSGAGRPDMVEGDVVFAVVTGDCTIGSRVDAMSVWVHSGSAVGASTVMVSGDADLGAGVITIEDMLTVHVTDALAVGFDLSADAPILK